MEFILRSTLRNAALGSVAACALAVAVATPASASPKHSLNTCEDARAELIHARILVGDTSHAGTAHALVVAERNDKAAQETRDAAIAAANTQYGTDVANAPKDDPATKTVDEHAVAIAKAAEKRDLAIKAAKDAYAAGCTAKALEEAREANEGARRHLLDISVIVGQLCKPIPVPAPIPAPEPGPAPEPAPVPAPAPAPAPATGGDNNTQVNVVVPSAPSQSAGSTSQIVDAPARSAETGDGSYAAR